MRVPCGLVDRRPYSNQVRRPNEATFGIDRAPALAFRAYATVEQRSSWVLELVLNGRSLADHAMLY